MDATSRINEVLAATHADIRHLEAKPIKSRMPNTFRVTGMAHNIYTGEFVSHVDFRAVVYPNGDVMYYLPGHGTFGMYGPNFPAQK